MEVVQLLRHYCFVFLVLATVHKSLQLSCGPCDPERCRNPSQLNCKGGLVLGVCQCCYTCAKLENEFCGGLFNMAGRCDRGLQCMESSSEFEPGKCVSKVQKWKDLPECQNSPFEQPWQNSPFNPCKKIESLFCSRECKSCCVHHTNCNPDIQKYVDGKRCRLEQKIMRYFREISSLARREAELKRRSNDNRAEVLESLISEMSAQK